MPELPMPAHTWKAAFSIRLRDCLPRLPDDKVVALSEIVWESAGRIPPDEAADIVSHFLEDDGPT
jgi:hypothetical protein